MAKQASRKMAVPWGQFSGLVCGLGTLDSRRPLASLSRWEPTKQRGCVPAQELSRLHNNYSMWPLCAQSRIGEYPEFIETRIAHRARLQSEIGFISRRNSQSLPHFY